MKKLDLYLIRQFLVTLSMTLMGFLCVILIVDLIENLDRFIDNAIPFKITLKYYFYAIPWFINIGLPMSMMISTIFSIGLLAKRNELTAMKATGISLYALRFPSQPSASLSVLYRLSWIIHGSVKEMKLDIISNESI